MGRMTVRQRGEMAALAFLMGAFNPFRVVDRWYWRLPWWKKALWHFATVTVGVFAGSYASRFARPS